MVAPFPWKIERDAVSGNSVIVDGAGVLVTRVGCAYGDDGAPEGFLTMFDDDIQFIVESCNAAASK